MKHHFGDFLDREGDYWTIIPNRDRYAHALGDVPSGSKQITIVTIGRNETHWKRIFTFPNLEELTLHEPSKEQLSALRDLPRIKRLRITHARPTDVEFLTSLVKTEELVLEYVSGFSDLSPLRYLRNLQSLHIENLRRVSDFNGLSGVHSLRYLHIDGTFDWKQPIESFEFMKGLPGLEVFSLGQVISKGKYPVLLPLLSLMNVFATEEYALLEVGLSGLRGASWDVCKSFASQMELPKNDIRGRLPVDTIRTNHPEVTVRHDGKRTIADPQTEWYEFLGKGAGHIKRMSPKAEQKCQEHTRRFERMKEEARSVIKNLSR